MATFDVPAKDRETLGELATLPAKQIGDMFHALQEAEPALLLADLADRVATAANLDRGIAQRVVRVLSTMYAVRARSGLSVADFVDKVVASVQRSAPQGHEADEAFRKNLAELLSIDSLYVTAKALDVFTEHDHVLCVPRVMTDMRPIFGMDDKPAAAVVIHTLKLSYHHGPKSETESFFVSLDGEDIRKLRDSLDRALQKEEEIKKIAKAQNLHVLGQTSSERIER